MSNLQHCTSLQDATGKLDYRLTNDRILNFEVQVVDEKDWPVRHIGFLDYNLEDFTPEFYATYMLLNIKKPRNI